MQTFPMPDEKRQVKLVGKVAYCLRAANLFTDINEQTTISKA